MIEHVTLVGETVAENVVDAIPTTQNAMSSVLCTPCGAHLCMLTNDENHDTLLLSRRTLLCNFMRSHVDFWCELLDLECSREEMAEAIDAGALALGPGCERTQFVSQRTSLCHFMGSQAELQCELLECGDRMQDCSREEMGEAIHVGEIGSVLTS